MIEKRNWEKVRKLEREHSRLKYKDLSPEERLKIYEDLYLAALTAAPEKVCPPWPGDGEWRKLPHLKHLIETRKKLHKIFAKC